MDAKLVMYLVYLVVSVLLTGFVARTLFRNGQVFLDDALGNEVLARSVNRLLVVGFWLLNLGYVALAIRVSSDISTASSAVENLSIKLGLVLLVLGGVHFGNLFVLSRFRRRRMLEGAPPPVSPTALLPAAAAPVAPPPLPPHPARPRPPVSPARPPAARPDESPWTIDPRVR